MSEVSNRTALAKATIAERYEKSSLVMNQIEPQAIGGYSDLHSPGYRYTLNDGEKYAGGLGPVDITVTDYWSLRQRSVSFFKKNPYCRGIIRRLETNVINTGLSLEASPIAGILGRSEDELSTWSMGVEDKFEAWTAMQDACHFGRMYTFGEFQRVAYREALIAGDVLVVERWNKGTNLPCYQLIDGSLIQSPLDGKKFSGRGNEIIHGVEINRHGEHVAYWVTQADLSQKRIKARGRDGRPVAWLYYASDKRHQDVRGEPIISVIMQSLSEVDRYRDSAQRKAHIGALQTMFFYQPVDSKTPGFSPVSAGANRRVNHSVQTSDGQIEIHRLRSQDPGLVYEQLPVGVEPRMFNADTTDEKFGEFEEAIVNGLAWSLEIPPSILKMTFGQSYSASRGEVKEFNQVLNKIRERFADDILRPVYRSWLHAMVLTQRIEAPGLVESGRNMMRFDEYSAWTSSCWWGAVKEAVDIGKEVNGHAEMINQGFSTHSRSSRLLTGTKFERNIARAKREKEMIAEVLGLGGEQETAQPTGENDVVS